MKKPGDVITINGTHYTVVDIEAWWPMYGNFQSHSNFIKRNKHRPLSEDCYWVASGHKNHQLNMLILKPDFVWIQDLYSYFNSSFYAESEGISNVVIYFSNYLDNKGRIMVRTPDILKSIAKRYKIFFFEDLEDFDKKYFLE